MKKLSLSELRRYIAEKKTELLTVNDLRNRRAVKLNFSERPVNESSVSCMVCTSHKHGELPDEYKAEFQNAYYWKEYACMDEGFTNLRKVEIWGGFSRTLLFNAGDAIFDKRKPCRTYVVTATQWRQMQKHMGIYDAITAPHEAFTFERLAHEGGRAYVDQKSVCVPSGYRWKL